MHCGKLNEFIYFSTYMLHACRLQRYSHPEAASLSLAQLCHAICLPLEKEAAAVHLFSVTSHVAIKWKETTRYGKLDP